MSPRRIILVVVFLLWAVNGALWAWVQFSPPPEAPPEKKLVKVFCDKKDLHKNVMKAVESPAYSVQLHQNESWKHQVQEGFVVVNTIPNKDTRSALLAAMKSILPVKIVGDDIRLGGVYPKREAALKAQRGAKNKGYDFEIADNIVEKTTKVIVVEIGPVEQKDLETVQSAIQKLGVKDDQVSVESVVEPPMPK